jgi:hypothetical protein
MAENVKSKPKVHRHAGLGLDYLLGTKHVLFESGVKMLREDFDAFNGDADFPVRYKAVEENMDSRGFDWRYACTTGILRRRRGEAARCRPKEAVEVKEQKKERADGRGFSSAVVVAAVMSVVGVGSAVMSAYHTSAFLVYGGKPVWTAVMTGTMLILFSGTAFTAARYFFHEGGPLNLFGVMFVAAGLTVIVYSMFSTLTVNFDQFKRRDDAEAAAGAEGSLSLAAHREQIRRLEEEAVYVAGEIENLQGEADYWRIRSWDRYDDITQRVSVLRDRYSALRERGLELVSETPRLADVEAVSQETVYGFLAGMFKVKESAMKFFVYVVPACLYDILAPFALSVVLLLSDGRRRKAGGGAV